MVSKLRVECEWLSGCLRVYGPGDPVKYIWSCTVQRVDDVLWLKGTTALPRGGFMAVREGIRQYCVEQGVARVRWERRSRTGQRKFIEYKVSRDVTDSSRAAGSAAPKENPPSD